MESLVEDANAILKNAGISHKYSFPNNSRDRYEPISASDMKTQYLRLKKSEVKKLYTMFKDDFLAFGYVVPSYLKINF